MLIKVNHPYRDQEGRGRNLITFTLTSKARTLSFKTKGAALYHAGETGFTFSPCDVLLKLLNFEDFQKNWHSLVPSLAINVQTKADYASLPRNENPDDLRKLMYLCLNNATVAARPSENEDRCALVIRRVNTTAKILNTIKQVIALQANGFNDADAIIEMVSKKYLTNCKWVHTDLYPDNLFAPLLFCHGIDVRYFLDVRRRYIKNQDWEALYNLVAPAINDEMHLAMLKKIILSGQWHIDKIDAIDFSTRELLEYYALNRSYRKECNLYYVPFFEHLIAFAYVECIQNNVHFKKCPFCGAYYNADSHKITCQKPECVIAQRKMTANTRKSNEVVTMANSVIKGYRNAIDRASYDGKYEDYVTTIDSILKYYRFVCEKLNRKIGSQKISTDELAIYKNWLQHIAVASSYIRDTIKEIDEIGASYEFKVYRFVFEQKDQPASFELIKASVKEVRVLLRDPKYWDLEFSKKARNKDSKHYVPK